MGSKYRARRNRLWIAQNGICAYCNKPCIPLPPYKEMQGATHPPNVFTTEHIIPIRRGGTEDPENLIGACLKCNMKKGLDGPDHRVLRHRLRFGAGKSRRILWVIKH